jgi:hypothetical protein
MFFSSLARVSPRPGSTRSGVDDESLSAIWFLPDDRIYVLEAGEAD